MSAITDSLRSPIIVTSHGKIQGSHCTTVYGDKYISFEGIPYAKPPLGTLRFKSPLSVETWDGILECTTVAKKSLQYNRYKGQVEGSEDCLYLNVYAKKLQSERRLAIMVYIHGGGFNTGDATRISWGPDYFMMKEVIFITIGYRLGPLGYISFRDPAFEVPGNAGLKDIVLALKWIKQNTSNFNGNGDNITLFGHSSGGSSTHLLMLSDKAKGLFNKAIIMAGFAFNLINFPNLEYRYAKHIGFEGENDERAIYEYLCKADASKLYCNESIWTTAELEMGYGYAFMPRAEPYESSDTIFSQPPVELLQSTWANEIPIMTGATSCESLLQFKRFTDPKFYENLQKHPEYLLPLELQNKFEKSALEPLLKKIIELHFKEKPVCLENALCMIDSYPAFYNAMYRLVQARRTYSKAPTYLYRFDFDSPTFNLYRIKHCGPNVRGVGHVDELSYLFWMPQSFELSRDSEEFTTIERMIDIFTAFAEKSKPVCISLKSIEWKPVESMQVVKCLNISNELTVIDSPEMRKSEVWATIYADAGIKLY